MHYLWYDTETGGLEADTHSLLTAYFGIYDREFNMIDDLYLQLKPEDESTICVTPKAMEITGINLEDHLRDPNTITYPEGAKKLLTMLNKHKIPRKRKHYRPSGHNLDFDQDFIWGQLLPKEDWMKTVHYNTLDTLRGLTMFQDMGLMPVELGQLTSLVEYFDIKMGEAHNAREDIKMNIEVYKRMKSMFQEKKKDFAGNSNNSLLGIIEGAV